jgi:hypothetical protein
MHWLSDQAFRIAIAIAVPSAFWLAMWLRLRPQWFRRLRAANWATTSGIIENGTVSALRAERAEAVVCTLNYSYRVDGSYYGGSCLRQFSDEQLAYDFINSKTGTSVQVKYDPAKPAASIVQ